MLSEPVAPQSSGLRLRALLIALPLCVVFAFITVYGDMVCKSVQIGILQLPPPAVGGLLLVFGLGRLVQVVTRRRVLETRDLLPIYFMLCITVMMCSRGTIEKLIPPTIEMNYLATPENQMMDIFGDYLPKALVAFDPKGPPRQRISRDFNEGNAQIHWRQWVRPLLNWSGLLAMVYVGFLCMSVILRRQWQDHEKLVFPLTTLPLTLMNPASAPSFFRNRLMWLGFALPAGLYFLNGLHENFPPVPQIRIQWVINDYLHQRPWNAIQYTPINISLESIGFFYFLAGDLLLSLWVFYLYGRLFDVTVTQLGYASPTMPSHNPSTWSGYQSAGAHVVLFIYLLRAGWPHFQQVWRNAKLRRASRDREERVDDGPGQEMISYRLAVWGLALSFIGSVIWIRWAGLDWWLAIAELGVYMFLICFVLARLVCEAGVLQSETSFRFTDLFMVWRPQASLGARNLTIIALLDTVLARDPRGLLLTSFLDNQKMAKDMRVRPRALLVAGTLAVIVAFIAGCYFYLTLCYRDGQAGLYWYPPGNAWNLMSNAAAAIQNRTTSPPAPLAMLITGIVVCTSLVLLRARWVGFPLHPLAYAVHAAWSMNIFWFAAFLAWVIKGFILRAGGMKLYRRMMPFFLGMTLGSFTSACLWTLVVGVARMKGVIINPPLFGFD